MKFELTQEEAVFVINAIGALPTQSGSFPLWAKMQQQYQQPPEAVEPVKEIKEKK